VRRPAVPDPTHEDGALGEAETGRDGLGAETERLDQDVSDVDLFGEHAA
jgi:hypothetical protein